MKAISNKIFQQIVKIFKEANDETELYYSSPISHKNWIYVKGLNTISSFELNQLLELGLGYTIFNGDYDIDEVDGLLKITIFSTR